MNLVKRMTTLADENRYGGYIDLDEKLWNGWSNPYFDKETMLQIYADLEVGFGVGYLYGYDESRKVHYLSNEEEEDYVDECKLVTIDGLKLYQVGKNNFCWNHDE